MHSSEHKVAKLADFGLAEKVNDTKNVVIAGTQGYAAPEILGNLPYDTSSDIWSLGCLLYAMLTVSLPFNVFKKPSKVPRPDDLLQSALNSS